MSVSDTVTTLVPAHQTVPEQGLETGFSTSWLFPDFQGCVVKWWSPD